MVVRRRSDPKMIIRIWNAINKLQKLKQPCYTQQICDEVLRNIDSTISIVNRQLDDALVDGLILATSKGTGKKQQLEYALPTESTLNRTAMCDGYDWYCFACGKAGDVKLCSYCWRVYHQHCIKNYSPGDSFVCEEHSEVPLPALKTTNTNMLIGFVIKRMRDKTQELYNFDAVGLSSVLQKMLLFRSMNLDVMLRKVRSGQERMRGYTSVQDLVNDIQDFLHNIFIIYGERSEKADLGRVILEDAQREIRNLLQCEDCYFFSNEKPKHWFCQPCHPPHDLVLARIGRFRPWPAKVLEISEDNLYSVRFFGGAHPRAEKLTASQITPITDISAEALSKVKGLCRAYEELEQHKVMLKTGADVISSGQCKESVVLSQLTLDLNRRKRGRPLSGTPQKIQCRSRCVLERLCSPESDALLDEQASQCSSSIATYQSRGCATKMKDKHFLDARVEVIRLDTKIDRLPASLAATVECSTVSNTLLKKRGRPRSRAPSFEDEVDTDNIFFPDLFSKRKRGSPRTRPLSLEQSSTSSHCTSTLQHRFGLDPVLSQRHSVSRTRTTSRSRSSTPKIKSPIVADTESKMVRGRSRFKDGPAISSVLSVNQERIVSSESCNRLRSTSAPANKKENYSGGESGRHKPQETAVVPTSRILTLHARRLNEMENCSLNLNCRAPNESDYAKAWSRISSKVDQLRKTFGSTSTCASSISVISNQQPTTFVSFKTAVEDAFGELESIMYTMTNSHQKALTNQKTQYEQLLNVTKKQRLCLSCQSTLVRYMCCETASYCSSACQRAHWEQHQPVHIVKSSTSNNINN